jgi:4-hydroxybenzoyl-CoA thioesterase
MSRSPYVVRKIVRFGHCDPAGIIYYPQYFMLAHDCHEDWLRDGVGYSLKQMIVADRRGLPIVKLDAVFTRPSRLGDELDFVITVRHVGVASLKLDYRCVCGGELRMRLHSVVVMTDLDSDAVVRIPDWLRARLIEFQEPEKGASKA